MIIQDKMVSNGMFSKAGRLTVEMYTILQEKDQILSGQKKSRDFDMFSDPASNNRNLNFNKADVHRTLRPEKSKLELAPKDKQPFARCAPREVYLKKLYNNNSPDNSTTKKTSFKAPLPKYHLVFNRSPLYQDKEFEEQNRQRLREFRDKMKNENLEKTKHRRKQFFSNHSQRYLSTKQNESILPRYLKASTRVNSSADLANLAQQSQIQQNQDFNNNNTSRKNQVLKGAGSQSVQQFQNKILPNDITNNNINKSQVTSSNLLDPSKSYLFGLNDRSKLSQSISMSQNSSRVLGIEFDKPKRKIYGPISLDKQVDKKVYLQH